MGGKVDGWDEAVVGSHGLLTDEFAGHTDRLSCVAPGPQCRPCEGEPRRNIDQRIYFGWDPR